MSQVIVILDSNTLTVSDWYFSDSPYVPVTPGIRLEVPEGLAWDTVKGVQDGEEVTLVSDPVKLQAKTAQAWTALRTQRNRLLQQSDWVALTDAHLSQDKKDAWFTYRQALRDLPDETTNPLDAEWPPAPGTSVPVAPVSGSRLSSLLDHAGESVQEVEAAASEPVPEPVVEAEPVVESEPVVEVPEVQEVVESETVVEVPEVQEVVEVPEPVVEVPEVPEVQEVVEVPEVPEVQEAEPVVEVPEVPEPVPEVPEVPASEPAPVELAASEPVV